MFAAPIHGLDRVDFDRGCLFQTTDLDEARDRCARVLNPHALQLVGPRQHLRSRMDHLRLGELSLIRLTWGADVAVDPDRLGRYYLLSIPLRGTARFHHGGTTVAVGPRCAGLVSAAPRFHFEASAHFEQLMVRVEREAIEAGWRALAGRPPARAIDFVPGVPIDSLAWQALLPPLRLLIAGVQGELAPLPHLAARVQDLLVTTLLLHQPHSLAAAGRETVVAPSRLLRRAEDHLRSHLDQPLTLGALALACGVGRRTLQKVFQDGHGLGPMQWLRRERLAAVRRSLVEDPADRPSVTQTALRFGFSHLGEFSRAYREAFGETPSATLARRG